MTRNALPTILALVLLFLAPVGPAANAARRQGEILTNSTVVEMTQAGLSPSAIVAKIRASATHFDTTSASLIRLKKLHVADDVIAAMVDAGPRSSGAAPAPAPRARTEDKPRPPEPPASPALPREPGIYVVRDGRLVQLEPTIYTQNKAGGMWKSALTYGVAKAQSKAVLRGAHASLQLDDRMPTFYFCFEVKSAGLSDSGSTWQGSPSSANEFVLAKPDVKTSTREMVVAQISAYTAQSGTLDKYIREFDYEKLAPGLYRVRPRAALEPGEYCFFYGGAAPLATFGYASASGGKLFDFGVAAAR